MTIEELHPSESLDFPPVYRRFLTGGPRQLRLSRRAALLVAGGAVMVAGVWLGTVAGEGAGWIEPLAAATATTLSAVLIAAMTARWLGNRLAVLAGWAYLTGFHVLLAPPSAAERLLDATVCAAMAAMAWANVPGRLPVDTRRWTAWVFYGAAGASLLLAGPAAPAAILLGCLLLLLATQHTRGLRFFACPSGILAFLLLVGLWWLVGRSAYPAVWGCDWTVPAGRPGLLPWLEEIPMRILPWTPFVLLAVVVGLYQGHYATPLWRFLGCWALAPLCLVAVGVLGDRAATSILWPPLAVIAAAGLSGFLSWCGRPGLCGRRLQSPIGS